MKVYLIKKGTMGGAEFLQTAFLDKNTCELVCKEKDGKKTLIHIYRDEEFDNQIILSKAVVGNELVWESKSLSEKDMGQWEPTFDSELWKEKQQLHLFGQHVQQVSGDPRDVKSPPSMVGVYEVHL